MTSVACAIVLALSAVSAEALTFASPEYLGSVDPGSPANAADEVFYINQLLSMAAPSSTSFDPPPSPPNTVYTFVRSSNSCVGCPAASVTGSFKDASGTVPGGGIDVTGWEYLLAKYGNTSYVWYVGGLSGPQTIPVNDAGGFDSTANGLSHYSLFNPTSVPEGGSTLMLLGAGLAAVGALRRRFNV